MTKKIVASAESLASLDLLIADKKAGKADFVHEMYWVIIIVIGGHVPNVKTWHMINDYPRFEVLDKVTNAVVNVFKGASVEELVNLREGVEVKGYEISG